MINLVENSAIHSREPRLTFIEATQLTKENPSTCVCYYIEQYAGGSALGL